MANCDSPKQIGLAKQCAAIGIAYFRFDFRGCGTSEGTFHAPTCLEDRTEDLLNAVSTMKSLFDKDLKIGLFGSSFGGTVGLYAADEVSPLAMVTFAAPIMSRTIMGTNNPVENHSKNRLYFDISHRLSGIQNILIVHGDADDVVPVSNAKSIFRLASPQKKLIIHEGGDHRMSDREHQEHFVDQSVSWFKSLLINKD